MRLGSIHGCVCVGRRCWGRGCSHWTIPLFKINKTLSKLNEWWQTKLHSGTVSKVKLFFFPSYTLFCQQSVPLQLASIIGQTWMWYFERDKHFYFVALVEQMGVRMFHRNLLQAAWLCCLLVVQVHSCPDICNKCSGPESDQCEECRAGWILHNNSCVGTVCRALESGDHHTHVYEISWVMMCICVCVRHWWVWHWAGCLSCKQLLHQHKGFLWVQR